MASGDLEEGKKYTLAKVAKVAVELDDDDVLPDDDVIISDSVYVATFVDVNDEKAKPMEKEFYSVTELRRFLKRLNGGAFIRSMFSEHVINTVKQKFAGMAKERPSKSAVFNFSIGSTTKEVQMNFFDRWDEKINALFATVSGIKDREKAFAQAMCAVKKGFLGEEDTTVKLRFPEENEEGEFSSDEQIMETFEFKKFDDWNKRADTYWWTYGMPDSFVDSYIQYKMKP